MNPKVYIIKEQMVRGETHPIPIDYSQAMELGDLEFITSHDMPYYPKSTVQQSWNADVNKFLTLYDPSKDYIICTGQPIAMFSVGWALGLRGKQPRFLVWRREENRYRVVHFDGSPFVQ